MSTLSLDIIFVRTFRNFSLHPMSIRQLNVDQTGKGNFLFLPLELVCLPLLILKIALALITILVSVRKNILLTLVDSVTPMFISSVTPDVVYLSRKTFSPSSFQRRILNDCVSPHLFSSFFRAS